MHGIALLFKEIAELKRNRPMKVAVVKLIERYVSGLGLDPNMLRVTALDTARERGSDIIDLKDFAGRSRDWLSKSPAYLLKY
ncbi:hypothetical protein [Paludisphaera borealis]|uniref:Uncharacterized protein n=1 Tax=Paludisphaera borealis TaxID=1387353 RepID=A0A1U7CIQ4_9BACT|nr:hypothetical protein [Paludisphaera borealis]APW58788.1 hypothetical protein BSF38_00192 [Paludisphaera borealis]